MTLATSSYERITSLDGLRDHLQSAIELEHATLPPYLCALYSLDPVRNPVATEVLTSVVVEEMLHLTLVANLLNAVGGRPRLDARALLPGYPRCLPHGDRTLTLSLLPFGAGALAQFLRLESPAPAGAPAQGDCYETIGQFYGAIRQSLGHLCDEVGEAGVFCGDPARQVHDTPSYRGGGRLIAIDCLASAWSALDEIVEQGEGASVADVFDGDKEMFHPERDEVAHYYRIQELLLGRRYRRGDTPQTGPTGDVITIDPGGVRTMRRNPRVCDHTPGHPVRAAQERFNRTYCALVHHLDVAFDGHPDALGEAIGVMFDLKAEALAILDMPATDGRPAGPTFEYVPDPRWTA